MDSEFKEHKCRICRMSVKNMNVHIKMNHKKKKTELSGFTMQSPRHVPIKRNTQEKEKSSYSRRAEISSLLRTEKEKFKKQKPVNKDIADKLSKIGNSVYDEVTNIVQQLAANVPTNPIDPNDTHETTWQDSEKASLNINMELLGVNRMASIMRKKINSLKVEQCPECKGLFQAGRSQDRREFRDHVGVCGLDGGAWNRVMSESPVKFSLDIKDERVEVKEENSSKLDIKDSLDIKEERVEGEEENSSQLDIKDENQLNDDNLSNTVECKMRTGVVQADIYKDSIQGRIEKEKVNCELKLGPEDRSGNCDQEIKISKDQEIKVEIKEEPFW
eukprot:GFUD01112095.1.p1 GENE.GFUD01112095.1~~GFUD01112095.1.p1  ORF type:complete len:331 (+),score=79.62 GFUD01112095.1:55-1047(+)